MTIEVALCLIKNHNEMLNRTLGDELYITEALNMASDALKKLIPKQPISDWDCGCHVARCPSCNSLLYCSDWTRETKRRYHQQYCLGCGQRLTKPTNFLGEWEEF